MEARRLLIADSNEDVCIALARALQPFHYVRCCGTGSRALEILRQERPDILVLNMMLPEIDGLTLLETIAAENIRPMVLALTTYRSYYLESAAYRLGVEYIMMRPFDLDFVINRVLDMKQYLRSLPPRLTPERILDGFLKSLSITPMVSGYPYIHEAILQMAPDPDRQLCKAVYRDVAKRFGVSVCAVESSIRRIIENHWDPVSWQQHFPDLTQPPAAKEFLRQMAWHLRDAVE